MTDQHDDLPPPYVPPVRPTTIEPAAETAVVPRWIVVYAMVGDPLLWVLHRVANGLEALDERGKEAFYGVLIMFAIWGLGSLLVVAIVYAGGVHAWARPARRPRLLRFGLGCSITWNILLVGLIILDIGATLAGPQKESFWSRGPGETALVIAALIWITSFVLEYVAWRRLGQMRWRAVSQ